MYKIWRIQKQTMHKELGKAPFGLSIGRLGIHCARQRQNSLTILIFTYQDRSKTVLYVYLHMWIICVYKKIVPSYHTLAVSIRGVCCGMYSKGYSIRRSFVIISLQNFYDVDNQGTLTSVSDPDPDPHGSES